MKKLAWAKLSTPIMLKISVSPLESMNRSIPYIRLFISEKTMYSSINLVSHYYATVKMEFGPIDV
jgi:hypothetical protein